MKRLIILALVVLSLAAVPAASADDTAPAAPTAPAQQQSTNDRANRIAHLRLRMKIVAHRFRKHCGTSATGAPERCLDVAKKAQERLAKLDANVQARIAKIQEACPAASTDEKCKNADKRIARLQKIEQRIEALAAKVQAWLDGTATSDTSLDQAAGELNQLVGSNG